MASGIIETSNILPPIITALIGAAAGLISGIVASLVAPWVHHAIEEKKKSIEYKINLILAARELLDSSETIKDLRKSSLWGFISINLNSSEKEIVFPEAIVVELSNDEGDNMTQNELRKIGISHMLSRLEIEWGLIKK